MNSGKTELKSSVRGKFGKHQLLLLTCVSGVSSAAEQEFTVITLAKVLLLQVMGKGSWCCHFSQSKIRKNYETGPSLCSELFQSYKYAQSFSSSKPGKQVKS